jgi:type II secretory pathway pseudopilin PulG
MRKDSGFSILELLGVVLIVGVLSAASTPSLLRAVQSYRLKLAAQQVDDAFQTAKFASMQANATRRVYLNTSAKTVAVGASTAATAVALPNGVSFTTISVAAPGIVSSAAANATTIGGQQCGTSTASVSFPATTGVSDTYEAAFNSRGLPTGTTSNPVNPGTVHWVYLTNTNGELMAVTITSAGSSQVWRWTGSAWSKS